eukprot:Pgem_evm2s5661
MFFNKINLLSCATLLVVVVSVNSTTLERRVATLGSTEWANENLEVLRKDEVNPKITKAVAENNMDPFHFGKTTLFEDTQKIFSKEISFVITGEQLQGINALEIKENGLYFVKDGFDIDPTVMPMAIGGIGQAVGSPLVITIPIKILVNDFTSTPRVVTGTVKTTLEFLLDFTLSSNLAVRAPYEFSNTEIQLDDVRTTIFPNSTTVKIDDAVVDYYVQAFEPGEVIEKDKQSIEKMLDEKLKKILTPALANLKL